MSTEPNMVVVAVYEGETLDPLEGSIDDVIDWLQKKKNLVPAEFREAARVVIDVDSEYDESSVSVKLWVSYERPETEEDRTAKALKEQEYAIQRRKWLERDFEHHVESAKRTQALLLQLEDARPGPIKVSFPR